MSKLTVDEVLQQVDSLLPNQYSEEQKRHWIAQAEGFVAELTDTAEEGVLTAPAPYCELYRHYVEAQIHYANAETERFNNAMALWNSLLLAYHSHLARSGALRGTATALKLC